MMLLTNYQVMILLRVTIMDLQMMVTPVKRIKILNTGTSRMIMQKLMTTLGLKFCGTIFHLFFLVEFSSEIL